MKTSPLTHKRKAAKLAACADQLLRAYYETLVFVRSHQKEYEEARCELEQLVGEGRSNAEIGAVYGVTADTASHWISECGIKLPRPGRGRSHPELSDEEWLREKYWTEGMSLVEIAAEIGSHDKAVMYAMKRLNIPRRRTGPRR